MIENIEERRRHTRKELGKVMNNVFSYIKFTKEMEKDFREEDGYNPTLDLSMKLDKDSRAVIYRYYEEPMANERCLDKLSAISYQSKMAILSQDVVRRMMNMCEEEEQEMRNDILNKYDSRMEKSGYSTPERKEIMRRCLISYERKREASMRGMRNIHRRGRSTLTQRYKKKLLGQENWYKRRQTEDRRQEDKWDTHQEGR